MVTRDEHETRLKREIAAAIQSFCNCHGDYRFWSPWEFDAEEKLINNVRSRVNQEDGFV